MNVNNIEKGMEVYGSDGDKIGSIADVYHTPGGGGTTGTQNMGNGDVVVEEVDVVEVVPDDMSAGGNPATVGSGTSGLGSTASGTSSATDTAMSGASGSTASGNDSGVTWNAGTGSTGDIGAIGTANDQNTSPGYVSPGTGGPAITGGGYIHVQQGGILGIGAKDLYIPLSEVKDVDPGNCISLSITKHQADENYQSKPDFLDNGNS